MTVTFLLLVQEFDMLEFYAGKGNLSRFMKLCSRTTGSLDIKYGAKLPKRAKPYKSDPMDILSPSGFAHLAMCIRNLFIIEFVCFCVVAPETVYTIFLGTTLPKIWLTHVLFSGWHWDAF